MHEKFGAVLDAFEYGAPPHGGIALGIDRWAALLADQTNIREVMAFPKTQSGSDLMLEAPSPPEPGQFEELGLRFVGLPQETGLTDGTLDRPGALGRSANTSPVVRLSRLVEPGMAEVWVKLEAANPTGSYKDRMALAMIEGAERSGRLRPGQTVVEYTGGSTGSSLALVCAVKGYPFRIVSATCFAEEKIRTMRAFGADVELIDSPEGITPTTIPRMMARAAEIAAETGAYQTDQFNNTDMIDGYQALGHELAEQLDGRVDAVCLYVGTAGCYLGTTRALRERLPALHRVAVEPAESAVLSGGPPGTHRIEGGGVGFVPPQLALRRDRRGHRGLDRRRVRDGPPRRPRGRRLVRPIDGREHHGGAAGRRPSRRGRPRRERSRWTRGSSTCAARLYT